MQSTSTLPESDDANREKPDRVQTQGGEAPDADKAADALSSAKSGKEEREDELLDEGLEETFPASDPVSAKHIT